MRGFHIKREGFLLQGLLQNTYLMLDLLHRKHNSLDETIINTKSLFHTNENFLKHFSSKMILLNILQSFSIYLLICFMYIMIISRNDTYLHYGTNKISLCCIILRNAIVAPE